MQEKHSATVVAGQQKFASKLSNWRHNKAESANGCFCTLILRLLVVFLLSFDEVSIEF